MTRSGSAVFCLAMLSSLEYSLDVRGQPLLDTLDDFQIVYPKVTKRSQSRDVRSTFQQATSNNDEDFLLLEIGNWTLEMRTNNRLRISRGLTIEWMSSDRLRSEKNLEDLEDCSFNGGPPRNKDSPASDAVLTVCRTQIYGYVIIEGRSFFIEPLDAGGHVLYEFKGRIISGNVEGHATRDERNENLEADPRRFRFDDSLTKENVGRRERMDYKDTSRAKHDASFVRRTKREPTVCFTRDFRSFSVDHLSGGKSSNTTIAVEREEEFFEVHSKNLDYIVDRTWPRNKLPTSSSSPLGWLELTIAADYSVVDFHGSSVQRYILALFNIVSAIYKDPSLDSNLVLVIVRMILYPDKEDGMVRQGNAKKSLENVNKWNRKLLWSSGSEGHDVAVWLTRLDIGGPSGYAPVSGACDPARSCALNRDEGLSSAFIVAHEIAHVLGLTHDGDQAAKNDCLEEASLGSVMAPMVAATFHRFHWSSCSKREFHRLVKQWSCLLNRPVEKNVTRLRATIQETFTMDEQCRMEFGDGYELCKTFDLPEPCSHLWCGNSNVSRVCKTKKGPPLEGTWCGEDKWCINGFCESVDPEIFGLGPLVRNVQDGGWGQWTSWSRCSRSCGIGVKFRTRKCDNPTPVFGGKDCSGSQEDFEVCVLPSCSSVDGKAIDFRAQQCSTLNDLLEGNSSGRNLTWLPYEPEEKELKCRLICRSKETGRTFHSPENLVDGTFCSYGSTDICIQGICQRMGCDNVLRSTKNEDSCGVCDGDDSTCDRILRQFQRKIRRGMTRVAILPRGANDPEVNITIFRSSSRSEFTLLIRDGRRRRNDLAPLAPGQRESFIVEGAAFRIGRLENDTYNIKASGRLLDEVVVSLAVSEEFLKSSRGTSFFVSSQFSTNRNTESPKERFVWIPGGFGPCTVSCGGGIRQKTIACKDDTSGRIVSRRKCLLSLKPAQEIEKCNTAECDFKWVPGPWEGCTTTCDNFGKQRREIYCVHASFNESSLKDDNNSLLYRMMMPPWVCENLRRPAEERECNRFPCTDQLVPPEWSTCTKIDETGVQSRIVRCDPPEARNIFSNCQGSATDEELRSCNDKNFARRDNTTLICAEDKSQYCFLPVLRKYCQVPGFRKRCCDSCGMD